MADGEWSTPETNEGDWSLLAWPAGLCERSNIITLTIFSLLSNAQTNTVYLQITKQVSSLLSGLQVEWLVSYKYIGKCMCICFGEGFGNWALRGILV